MNPPQWWRSDKPYIIGDCLIGMKEMPNESVDLIVTSPPYNVGKEYEEGISMERYKQLLNDFCDRAYSVLKPDGRICINVAQTMGTRDQIFSPLFYLLLAFNKSELKMRDIIIWNQVNSGNDTSWGSFASASAPWLRHQTESILVGYKEQWKKLKKGKSTISNRDFTVWSVDMWLFSVESDRSHPAPYPVELPTRCIEMFTYEGDVVLDPFLGSGTTIRACRETGRIGLGFEKNDEYEKLIKKRALTDTPYIEEFLETDDENK